ncbi:MAG: SDR family oxidoreductase [Actinobacteria bacterium]|nr:MAG: SDR family oxidoreductase [Actinomycetota bacterium]
MSVVRAALVAGGSSGIGLEIARVLASEGHSVTIVGRRPDKLASAAEVLGGSAHVVAADLSEDGQIEAVVASHRSRFGRLDTLVNSAGYGGPRGSIERIDVPKLDRILRVDLRAAMLLTRACLPMLRDAGSEHGKALVVNVSSVAAVLGLDEIATYSAAKGGLLAFGRGVQRELADAGVQVTTLLPAYVDTAMSDWVPVPREEMLRPSDLAEAVRLLLRVSPACRIPELRFERIAGPV